MNLNDITSDEIVSRINRFVGAIASMEHINPMAGLNHLRSKLHGLSLAEFMVKQAKNLLVKLKMMTVLKDN